MKKIHDTKQIEYWMEKGKIRSYFDTPNLTFHAYQYEKGEYLTTPSQYIQQLLFLVSGAIQIYGIRDNGSISPVNHIESAAIKGPILIGDIEFSNQSKPPFFVKAQTDAICIALPINQHREQLNCDLRFLHMLLQSYADKLQIFVLMDIASPTIEERLLLYMKNNYPCCELTSIEATILQLHCSRRQLQRVLKKLCNNGQIEKIGRGKYRLVTDHTDYLST